MANFQLSLAIAEATNALMHAVATVTSVNNNQLASAFQSSVEADACVDIATEASNNVIAAMPNTADASLAMAAASLATAASHIASAAVNAANVAQAPNLNQAEDEDAAQAVDLNQAGVADVAHGVDQNVAQAGVDEDENPRIQMLREHLGADPLADVHFCHCHQSNCDTRICGCKKILKRCTTDCSCNQEKYPCRNR